MIPPGTTIKGRYAIRRYLASGGMQDVYVAHDTLTELDVALKTPQAGQRNRRFRQSAQLAARINHYNVARTLDYFEDDGAPYLVEELVEGASLEEVTLRLMQHIDPHMGAHLMLRLSKGVAASHHAGVAHRDLKPGNVLVAGGLTFSEIKLTDFGIATLAEELFEEVVQNGGDLTRSTSGTIQGALPYMAPEMMFRRPGDKVGSPADVWSLGAMMFRLLTGEYPFGEGMMVPVNVNGGIRTAWPTFMLENPQFAPLARSLQEIIELCLQRDATARPSADQLVFRCEELCYHFAPRRLGTVTDRTGSRGRLRTDDGNQIFFHADSHYGSGRVGIGQKVLFADHPGKPHRRAHPLVSAN